MSMTPVDGNVLMFLPADTSDELSCSVSKCAEASPDDTTLLVTSDARPDVSQKSVVSPTAFADASGAVAIVAATAASATAVAFFGL